MRCMKLSSETVLEVIMEDGQPRIEANVGKVGDARAMGLLMYLERWIEYHKGLLDQAMAETKAKQYEELETEVKDVKPSYIG